MCACFVHGQGECFPDLGASSPLGHYCGEPLDYSEEQQDPRGLHGPVSSACLSPLWRADVGTGLLSNMSLLLGKRMVSLWYSGFVTDCVGFLCASAAPLTVRTRNTVLHFQPWGRSQACLVYMTISVANSGSRVRFIDCSCGAEKGSLEQSNVNLVQLLSQPSEV